MQPFVYARPGTLSEALALLGEHGSDALLLAGGTDVVVGLRNRSLRPRVPVSYTHLTCRLELESIRGLRSSAT